MEKDFIKNEIIDYIRQEISFLSWQHEYAFNKRFGLDGQFKSIEEISKKINCSVQRVYDLLKESIDFIKKKLKWEGYLV